MAYWNVSSRPSGQLHKYSETIGWRKPSARAARPDTDLDQNILLVTSGRDQLEDLWSPLQHAGYRVSTASSVLDALEVVDRVPPSLVLTDLVACGGGIELCHVLRGDSELSQIPILFASSERKDSIVAIEGLDAGADDFLELPCDEVLLVAQVARLIERGHYLRSLRTSEMKYRMLMEQASDAVFILNSDGRILEANSQAATVLGRSKEELPLLYLGELEGTVGTSRPPEWLIRLKPGDSLLAEWKIRRPDNSVAYLEISASILPDRRIEAIARDITRRKLAEEEVARLNDNLEQRVLQRTVQLENLNQELEFFCYSVSHDLNAPLGYACGIAQLLDESLGANPDNVNVVYARIIKDSIEQVRQLIEELLEFSKISREQLRVSEVESVELLLNVLADLQPEIADRTVVWDIEELPPVYADPLMLRLVWQNLLSNAVKYTRTRSTATIEIRACETNGEFVFSVRDNGIGFDNRYAAQIFDVFRRLHSEDDFGGSGIGLASVSRIIDRHGGRAWAEGAVGEGAAFFFSLPKGINRHQNQTLLSDSGGS